MVGDVVNQGVLAFDRSTTELFDGVISGSGAIEQRGVGTTVLTANNTYTGGTTIADGELMVGNGGTSGAIVGDVSNQAILAFNRADEVDFTGTISGTGALSNLGAGDLVLSADNSYTGATDVNSGGLYINGDQSAATGITTVNSGATLGGIGTIGGDTNITAGATLAPGELGSEPGMLTINGDLSLATTASMAFNLGEANIEGGALNDLVQVSGDVELDGTLDVTTSSGGSFDTGIYRIIGYDGVLTDNGLTIGTIPSPDFYVQTSIDKQVNLVNTSGLALRYWDGASGPKNNSIVNGGDGIWQNNTGNDNWVDEGSIPNAPFNDDAFAIFAGDSGTVTVDTGLGTVNAGGMQFATDGYVIEGDELTLVEPQSTIRVGDGTIAGADYTAVIESRLTGSTQLLKTDLGTLTLTGNNDYSGGTAINGGTLEVSADTNLGAASGDLSFDGGNLRTNTDMISGRDVVLTGNGSLETLADTTLTLNGDISGAGALAKQGGGTLVLSTDSSHAGGTTIQAGILQLGDGGTAGSISGDISNDSMLVFNRSDALTVDGRITGSGAVSQIGTGTTILTGSNSYSGGTSIGDGTLQIGDGGSSGAVNGDIVNDGSLAFNRNNTLTIGGDISGSGDVRQRGTGTIVLTGSNSYSGDTLVQSGTLRVNGDQSAATGHAAVADGATLGGEGILGGNVTVASGGTLAPGNSPGTLTLNGDLLLNENSLLDFELGASDIAGGPLNDLIEVGGDLTLDGILNVSTSSGGIFGPGTYRLINYDGSLTNNDLELGNLPANSDARVQTSVAQQVNLINTGGLILNYWDGPDGEKNDGSIHGGDGVWTVAADNDWTESNGNINAAYANGSYAIFTGTAGKVTIDNSDGDVTASGLQFAVDGYQIDGDYLTLAGPQSIIRVGDGSADGAKYTATIDAMLTGESQLLKSDLGTLILTAANNHNGTVINGGNLQIASDDALGVASGELTIDGGALRTTADIATDRHVILPGNGTIDTADETTLTLNGTLSGSGNLQKTGAGTLHLTGNSSDFSGTSSLLSGTLIADTMLSGAMDAQARLEGAGSVGSLHNHAGGVIAPGHDGEFETLTVTGDYLGDGGTLEIEAELAGDDSATDRLRVDGATSGSTVINVINQEGPGGQTQKGIKVVDVDGMSKGTFTLAEDYFFEGEPAVVAGAYAYRLYQNGVDTPQDGDWYLRSTLSNEVPDDDSTDPLYQPGVSLYEAYAGVLQNFNRLESLRQRVGDRAWQDGNDGTGIWARMEGRKLSMEPKSSTSDTDYDVHDWQIQTGSDAQLKATDDGHLVGGISGRYAWITGYVDSPYGSGRIKTNAFGVRGTLTWYGTDNFYVDSQLDTTWYSSDLFSDVTSERVAGNNEAFGYGGSIEIGQRYSLNTHWGITPQVQWSYTDADINSFTDAFGARISQDKSYSLRSRVGLAVDYTNEWDDELGRKARIDAYGVANLYYDSADGTRVNISETRFHSDTGELWGGLGYGVTYNGLDDLYLLYAEISTNTSLSDFGDSYSVQGNLGIKIIW